MPSTERRQRRPGQGLSASKVKPALRGHAEDLFRAAFGEPARAAAHEWRDRDKGAVAMQMRGEGRGVWFDFSADAGGDLFDLVAITRCNLASAKDDFPRVLEEAARMVGMGTGPGAWRGFSKPKRPESNAARDDGERKDWHAATVAALLDRIRPVAGTPAASYAARRGITDLPESGLGWLPPVPDVPVRDRRRGALLVWGLNNDGWPMGGQRILLTATGRKPRVKALKPAFGQIGGFPARFPARSEVGAGPLVVAEGPESALSIRQATGLECWAVFGVSNWKHAPLPQGRVVILAPDRDAPGSKADVAFRRAVFIQHSQRGRLLVAEAPEPEGSGKDLNDTLQRAGDDAVRAAIMAARPVTDADMEDPKR